GAGLGGLALALPAFVAVQAASPLLQNPPLRRLQARVVTEHNLRLADELGLDPHTLEPAYFPAPR
ncbi:MAG: hypothetical protein AB2A00_20765, partial [Myxococcota bacterium]